MKKEKKIEPLDLKEWNDFTKNPKDIFDKEKNKNIISKQINQYKFDLHGFSLDAANDKMKDLIKISYEKGVSKLVIVTGKGLQSKNEKDPYVSKDFGILKYSVPEYINSNKELMNLINEIKDASVKDGGGGAFYIYLKKKPTK